MFLLALLPWYAREARRRPARLSAGDVAEKLSTASNGSLLTNSQPIFTTLLAPLIINEEFTPLRLVGPCWAWPGRL